jgi:hypothetical protein
VKKNRAEDYFYSGLQSHELFDLGLNNDLAFLIPLNRGFGFGFADIFAIFQMLLRGNFYSDIYIGKSRLLSCSSARR